MIASVLIDQMLPALKTSYLVEEVLEWMDESELSQLPVVDAGNYLGLVSLSTIEDPALSGEALSEIPLEHAHTFASEDQHIIELVGLALQNQLKVIPVLGKGGIYLGSIAVGEMLEKYADAMDSGERGAVLVLNVKPKDYSLSEISRLVESNGAKIMMSYYTPRQSYDINGENLLTLKLNQVNVAHILATLERFGYVVTEVHASEPVTSVDQERLDMLMRYLAT